MERLKIIAPTLYNTYKKPNEGKINNYSVWIPKRR